MVGKWHAGLLAAAVFILNYTKAQESRELTTPESVYYRFEAGSEPQAEEWHQALQRYFHTKTTWEPYSTLNDPLDQTHIRIRQLHNNIPLENGVMVLHFQGGRLLSFNGEYIPETLINGSVGIDEKRALEAGLGALPAETYYWQDEVQNALLRQQTGVPDTSWFPRPELVYAPAGLNFRNPHRLCYRMDIYAASPLAGKRIYVDAETGDVIAGEDLVLHTDVKGTAVTAYSGNRPMTTDSVSPGNYRLREKARGKGIETFNMQKGTSYGAAVDFTDADNYWNNFNANKDEVATDAHWGAEKTYDFFDTILGRNSFDGNGAKIISYVHYSNNYSNAFWNGAYMTYGDGNGSTWKPLTSIDVCGHEISHAVTTYTAGLVYSYESGALNESFSDIFGNAIERWARPGKYNWKMGEDFTTSGNGIRDMSNPIPYNNPKYYKGNKWYTGAGDNGGVHYNSGVQNYWFYLITEGISGTNEVGSVFDIDSLGLIDASRIAYRNLSVYLTKNSQYADARTYSIMAAADLFGNCSKHVIAVTNAWWACGVGPRYDSGYVKAAFTADTLVCKTGKAVNFYNRSENSVSSKWYFGDGNTSTVAHPVHYYGNYGTYTVKLVARSCSGLKTDSMTRTAYVKVDSTYDICRGILMPKNGTDSAVQCNGFIYDDGGEGNYGALRQTNLKVKIPGAVSIRFRFLVLDYENGYDSIVLFRNNIGQANKIGRFTGSTLPFGGTWQTVTADALWLRHYSDPYVEGKGFKIEFEGIRNPLTLELGNDTTICMGDSLILNPVTSGGYSPDYRFLWSSGHAALASSITVKPTVQTKYRLRLQDICTLKDISDSILISVRQPLNVTLGRDTVICEGRTVRLQANASGGLSPAYQFLWNQGLGNNAVHLVKPVSTTLYQVILSDGCSEKNDTAWQKVTVKPALDVKLSVTDSLVCIGQNITLTASGSGGDSTGYTYTWNQGLGTGLKKTVTMTDTGFYSVTLTDGCSVTSATTGKMLLTRPPIALRLNADTVICRGSGLDLLASASGGIGTGYSFSWTHGKNTAAITETPTAPTTYKVTVSDACSPVVSDSVTIQWLPSLTLTRLNDTTLCDGQSWTPVLTASGGLTSQHNISWTPPSITGFSPSLNPPTGTTLYTAILSDGCTVKADTTRFRITKLAPLSAGISVSPPAICLGDSITVNLAVSGGKSASRVWTLNGIPVSWIKMRLQPAVNTTFNLVLNDGCSLPANASSSVVISPAAAASLSVTPSDVCLGSAVTFSYTSPDATLLRWILSNGDSVDGTGQNLAYVFALPGSYTASARVITSMGCSGLFNLSSNINVVDYPKAIFSANPQTTNIENSEIQFTDASTGATQYEWIFGDGSNSFVSGSLKHLYADTGWFRAELKVGVFPGCRDSMSLLIRVKDVYRLHIPNGFTPDDNGINDVFMPNGRGIKAFHMTIYNRWGMKVFETHDMTNGWTGKTPDDKPWDPGMYPVLIEVIDSENFRHVEKSILYLSR